MEKNIEILKGIEFDNLNDEGLKQLLIAKFAKNINKDIVPGESYIPVSGKVIDEEDDLSYEAWRMQRIDPTMPDESLSDKDDEEKA